MAGMVICCIITFPPPFSFNSLYESHISLSPSLSFRLFFLRFCHFSTLRIRTGKRGEEVGVCVHYMCPRFWESVEQRPKTISIKPQTCCQCHSVEKSSQKRGERERERDVIEKMTKHVWLRVCMRAEMCECIQ